MKASGVTLVCAAFVLACGASTHSNHRGNGGAPSEGSGGKSANEGGKSGGGVGSGATSGMSAGATSGASSSGTDGFGLAGGSGGAGTNGSRHGGVSGANAGGVSGTAAGGDSAGTGITAGRGQGGSGATACPDLPSAPLMDHDIIQFNDNGAWNWFQDERALVDTKAGKFIVGSVASGGSRDGDQEVVIYDIASGDKQRYTLEADLNVDDHDAPAFILRPDGGYAALWATHRDTCFSYYSTFDGTAWAAVQKYDWSAQGCPWNADTNRITYANPWYLSAEDRVYAAVRSVGTNPAFLVSSDAGKSWNFYGRLTATPALGFTAGYYKYWGNGADRIDFVATEAHPRDFDNSLWHGYYEGGKLYDSNDNVVDDNAGDTDPQAVTKFTEVFATGTSLNGIPLFRLWNHDMVRYSDGTIAVTAQARADNRDSTPLPSDPDKRLIYSRWDGTSWKSTYLVKAGPKLFTDEEDYTGLSAVHPDDPNVIFVSTTFDPRDDTTQLAKHEIFMGVTCDDGATWEWAPITQNSTSDNIRPIVPKWDSAHTLLLWLRGLYISSQDYKLEVVGTTALSLAK
jgi:hypothetical protein